MDTVSALWIQYQRCGYSISDVDTCCAATLPRCHAAALRRCPGCKDPPAEGGGGESEQAGPLLNTGYGLASRITAAFGSGAATVGIFYERPSEEGRPATPGWYNSIGFTRAARAAGLYAANINGDAFSDAIKSQALETIRRDLGQVDLVVYSLASPRRTHPKTAAVHKSVLKPVGSPYTNKTVDTNKGVVSTVTIEPASEQEIADTVAVMGGEDWELWMNALAQAKLLAPGAQAVAYSYIGPEVTWAIYRNGTIGLAKNDLKKAARNIDSLLKRNSARRFDEERGCAPRPSGAAFRAQRRERARSLLRRRRRARIRRLRRAARAESGAPRAESWTTRGVPWAPTKASTNSQSVSARDSA